MNTFPTVILDLYPYCNAKCKFCSYHTKTTTPRIMEDYIWKEVVKEIGFYELKTEIVPFWYGEPLLNPKLFDVCDYISEHAPTNQISISTNASLLTIQNIEKLLKVKTLGYLNFSLYAGTKDTYEELMGLDYTTLDRVENTIKIFKQKRPGVKLCVGATSDPRFVTMDDCKELDRRFGDIVSFHPISFNYQHRVPECIRIDPDNHPCNVIFTQIVIHNDGKVGMCCFDVNGDIIIGDVTKNTLYDIINGDIANKYRAAHKMGLKDVIPLCRSCTQPY